MKKKFVLIGYLIGFLSCFLIVQIKDKYQITTIKYNNLVGASGEVAIMVFDESLNDYVRQENVPVGDYKLNADKSYCIAGGEILGYDNDAGKVNYKLFGADDCYIYFEVYNFIIEQDDYIFAWEAYPGATAYNIYSNGSLLTTITDTSIDLSKIYTVAGTYEIRISAVKPSVEKMSYNTISYTIEKLYPLENTIIRQEVNGDKGQLGQSISWQNQFSVPSSYDSVTYINLLLSYGTTSARATPETLKPILTYNYCENNSDCVFNSTIESVKGYSVSAGTHVGVDTDFKLSSNGTVSRTYGGYGTQFAFRFEKAGYISSAWYIGSYSAYAICVTGDTIVYVYDEKKRKFKKKKIKYVTYKDKLLCWDFDNGCFAISKPLWIKKKETTNKYNLLKFSDGSKLKTIDQHRIYNKEKGMFTYPMTDATPIGTTTFNSKGEYVTLISKEVIGKKVDYYNIITDYHMNLFTGNILTSCRMSNLYPIENMKYVKDDRKLKDIKDFDGIDERWIKGLRLLEQPENIDRGNATKYNDIKGYIMHLEETQRR